MNNLVEWFAKNRVAANLFMVSILILGALAIPETRKELIPNISLDRININVPYPGSTPSEVESSVIIKIEEKLFDLEGIRSMASTASESGANIVIEIANNYNTREILDKVKSRINTISTFPENTQTPIIKELSIRTRVAEVILSGKSDELTLKRYAEKIRDDLTALPAITQVELSSIRPYEIAIELSEHNMKRYGLSFDEVTLAVKNSSLNLPAGVLKTKSGDVLLRTESQAYKGDDFEKIVIRAGKDGSQILLGDIANVIDGFAEQDLYAFFNGKPSVALTVFRVGNQSVLEIAKNIRNYVQDSQLPNGLEMNIWQDRSEFFQSRLSLLLRNAITGLLLVFGILVLFLRVRLALWVTLGIPISFMGALWLLPNLDGSINMISMFAFILVLGIVVDDAIIIGESIYAEHGKGHYGLEGAIRGVKKVSTPVIFAVLTSIVAFAPILFLPGPEGRLWSVIPIVVIATLFFSLIESIFILPAHLSTIKHPVSNNHGKISGILHSFTQWLETFIETRYRPLIEFAIKWRYATSAIFVGLFIIFTGLVAGGWLSMVFFPKVEGDFAYASVRFAQGSSIDKIENAVQIISDSALKLKSELRQETNQDEITSIKTVVGSHPSSTRISGSHLGEVSMELGYAEQRQYSAEEIMQRWRNSVGEIPGVVELKYESSLRNHGAGINLELSGKDIIQLQTVSTKLKNELKQYSGLYGIHDSFDSGKREIRIKLKSKAKNLAINTSDLARQVRQAFYGEEIQRIQRGRDDVKVFVRYPKEDRKSLYTLETMHIRLSDGTLIPLVDIAELSYSTSPSVIKRFDRKRIITVSAFIDESITSSSTVMNDLKPKFLKQLQYDYPDVKWSLSGRQKAKDELISTMKKGFLIALVAIFVLMAIPFQSYTQPLMVMSAIPFGLIGALIGHIILGLEISLLSLCGMIAVAGVVVNDNLVLVDSINRLRAKGIKLSEAIRNAGAERFRPILLTSLTTFAGLTPLMLERSVQAQFLIPMAVSLAFGVMFATVVTLILIPVSYHILDDFHQLMARTFSNVDKRPIK
ncbi:Acriflavin resistance protein [hydrothermal vent metagenome]|uniref:Acriflavin resistance protein n=1 Tax=hydrothermal vent metagenome TaxID=652676 RepID=A0A3B1AJ27_9ZZZZ